MSIQSRQEILHLYRHFLRTLKLWPPDDLRPNRSLRNVLYGQIREEFRKNLNVEDPEISRKLMEEAKMEYIALQKLVGNEYKEKYALSARIFKPSKKPSHYKNLLAQLEKAAKKKRDELHRPSLWRRLFG
ncbi:1785_t:CDS:2 [Paraglomus brasilianum]|uniref:1785_t:CDS:1 n=1 Tax=Paraglomus brasilianum TaxID=144538 RepID=A0A9N9AHS0_9GLOM|nr:1785_t:CDS:2 [Paraglomus brasilianum]